jgi:hypothetical protein
MELINGAVALAVVTGIAYLVCRLEIRRQLGEDYRNFIETIRYHNRQNKP